MTKTKFECRLSVWVPASVAEAYEQLAADGMLAVSDHMRLALVSHLQHLGVSTTATSRPIQQNGKHPEQANGL
jgi:hypothetical protein